MERNYFITSLIPELCCTHINTSLDYYIKILGFNIQYQRENDGFAMLERQGSQIMLSEIRTQSVTGTDRTWLAAPLVPPYGRGINLQIKTTEVDKLYDHVVRNSQCSIFLSIEEKWYRADQFELGNRQFIVLDPDGYMLRFFQDLGERRTSALISELLLCTRQKREIGETKG
jgi:catechol 2,3-dioxygenase-like lactoylglutathione lyase family enzyme